MFMHMDKESDLICIVLVLDILFDKNTIFCKQLQTKYFIAR